MATPIYVNVWHPTIYCGTATRRPWAPTVYQENHRGMPMESYMNSQGIPWLAKDSIHICSDVASGNNIFNTLMQ